MSPTRAFFSLYLAASLVVACSDDKPAEPGGPRCGDGVCSSLAPANETFQSCPADCSVVDAATGWYHTCAVLVDGSVRCWGGHGGHQLAGVGDVNTPVTVPGISGAVAVSAGQGHTCVLLGSGSVQCWGRNGFGEVGTGTVSRYVFPPQTVGGLSDVTSISAGSHHTCATKQDQQVVCWGRGDNGQVGGGEFRLRNPTPVAAGSGSVVSSGLAHTCVRRTSDVACFGNNYTRRLGTTSTPGVWRNEPTPATLGKWAGDVDLLAAGNSHTCARVSPPKLANPPRPRLIACWGANDYGQLGFSGAGNYDPDVVPGFEPGGPLVAANRYTCARSAADNDVYCWGRNTVGQLGLGHTNVPSPGPQRVDGVRDATAIDALLDHTCAVTGTGALFCWGANGNGQLGNGSTDPYSAVPVAPVGL